MNLTEAQRSEFTISEETAQQSLAALIRNTRTTARSLSLVDIEKWLTVAIARYGSVKAVAEKIDLSTKMLRRFKSIAKLSSEVREMFAKREIDSVDAAEHLSRLVEDEQLAAAKQLAEKCIDTSDLRGICELRRKQPQMQIDKIIDNIKATRNIRQYRVEFMPRGKPYDTNLLRQHFLDYFGAEGVVSFRLEGAIAVLVLTKSAARLLETRCKETGASKRQMIMRISEGKGV